MEPHAQKIKVFSTYSCIICDTTHDTEEAANDCYDGCSADEQFKITMNDNGLRIGSEIQAELTSIRELPRLLANKINAIRDINLEISMIDIRMRNVMDSTAAPKGKDKNRGVFYICFSGRAKMSYKSKGLFLNRDVISKLGFITISNIQVQDNTCLYGELTICVDDVPHLRLEYDEYLALIKNDQDYKVADEADRSTALYKRNQDAYSVYLATRIQLLEELKVSLSSMLDSRRQEVYDKHYKPATRTFDIGRLNKLSKEYSGSIVEGWVK